MARTFKSLLGDDVVNTRTLLHEAIPITGTISSGTYSIASSDGADEWEIQISKRFPMACSSLFMIIRT